MNDRYRIALYRKLPTILIATALACVGSWLNYDNALAAQLAAAQVGAQIVEPATLQLDPLYADSAQAELWFSLPGADSIFYDVTSPTRAEIVGPDGARSWLSISRTVASGHPGDGGGQPVVVNAWLADDMAPRAGAYRATVPVFFHLN